MFSTETLTASDRFALTLDGLCRAVAARIVGGALSVVMILTIWRRVRRIEGQIQALLARFRAGRLRARAVVRLGGRGGRAGVVSAGLPRRFGWLLPLVPHEAACFASQMCCVLAENEMVALLEASPQARRVLRPLCRMLGVEAWVLAPSRVTRLDPGLAVEPGAMRDDPGSDGWPDPSPRSATLRLPPPKPPRPPSIPPRPP